MFNHKDGMLIIWAYPPSDITFKYISCNECMYKNQSFDNASKAVAIFICWKRYLLSFSTLEITFWLFRINSGAVSNKNPPRYTKGVGAGRPSPKGEWSLLISDMKSALVIGLGETRFTFPLMDSSCIRKRTISTQSSAWSQPVSYTHLTLPTSPHV